MTPDELNIPSPTVLRHYNEYHETSYFVAFGDTFRDKKMIAAVTPDFARAKVFPTMAAALEALAASGKPAGWSAIACE